MRHRRMRSRMYHIATHCIQFQQIAIHTKCQLSVSGLDQRAPTAMPSYARLAPTAAGVHAGHNAHSLHSSQE